MIRVKNLHYVQSVIVAFAFSLFYCVLIPVQTYLGNTDMFSFTLGEVIAETLPSFFAYFGVILVGILVSELFLGRLALVIVLAALLAEYFETGLFSIGLPPLNGAIWAFGNPFRAVIDTALLLSVFGLCLILYKWLKSVAHWIALGVLVMTVASLFDARKNEVVVESALSKGYCASYDVVKSLRFSPKRNVLFLVLDSFPASIAERVARENPELASHFEGFVAYDNNLAMHEMTVRGLPGLMTGKFLEKDVTSNDYIFSTLGEDSFVYPYVTNGCSVYCCLGLPPGGYTNRKLGNFSNMGVGLIQDGPVLHRNSTSTPYISLGDVVRFRLAPYRKKGYLLDEACSRAARNQVYKDCNQESYLYPEVLRCPVGEDTSNTVLAVLHTTSIHGPITHDRNNNPLSAPSHDPEAFYEFGIWNLGEVAKFLDGLKQKGIYDQTMIIMAADHGLIELRKGDGTAGHGAESSILWVKPFGVRGPMKHLSLPTSNCRVAGLVKRAMGEDLSERQIASMLEMHDRKFRAKFGSTVFSFGKSIHFYEWKYDDQGNVVSLKNIGIFEAN